MVINSHSTRDQNLIKIEEARRASAIFGITHTYVNEVISRTVHQMVSGYRNGSASYEFLLGKTAEITALMNLLSDLEASQRKGSEAAKKEFGNAS